MNEIGIPEIGTAQNCASQICMLKLRSPKKRATEVEPASTRLNLQKNAAALIFDLHVDILRSG